MKIYNNTKKCLLNIFPLIICISTVLLKRRVLNITGTILQPSLLTLNILLIEDKVKLLINNIVTGLDL